MMRLILLLCLLIPSAALADPVVAYIGPGLGLGVIGAILAFFFSILVAIWAFFWYPIKRFFKRITGGKAEVEEQS